MPIPPNISSISYGDKLIHMAGYVCLFVWFSQIYQRQYHWRLAAGLIILGVFIEMAQSMTDYRSFEFADMFANTTGVVLGWLIAGSPLSFVFVKIEAIFYHKQNV